MKLLVALLLVVLLTGCTAPTEQCIVLNETGLACKDSCRDQAGEAEYMWSHWSNGTCECEVTE